MDLGYNASVDYVMSQLQQYPDYFKNVQKQVFPVVQVIDVDEPQFSQVLPNPTTYTNKVDFQSIAYSGTGDVNDLVYNVGTGCTEQDYNNANFAPGKIAIALNTPDCRTSVRASVAQTMNVSGLLIYNDEPGLFYSSAKTPFPFPIFSLTNELGLEIVHTMEIGTEVTVKMVTNTAEQTSYTINILADTPHSGDGSKVIVTGSHLDSVPEGPGINDNGSGSATNLEMALLFASTETIPVNPVRFAWWAAEELGLKGSRYYVSDLKQNNPEELARIALNVNYDMLGSPNFFRGIYNGTQGAEVIRTQSEVIMGLYVSFFNRFNLPWGMTDFDGRSDYGPFLEENIPAGGLFSGAEVKKTAEQRQLFGGIANMAYDTCYHMACDTLDNINREILEEMAQAAAYAVYTDRKSVV